MAVPFFVPEEPKSETTSTTVELTTNSATNLNDQSSTISNVPTSQPQTPHTSNSSSSNLMNSSSTLSPNPANNEYLVQAFCDALHRFSLDRGTSASPTTPQFTPESSPSYYQNTGYQGQVFFSRNFTPATSRSTQNSPRHSFRASKRIRRSSTQSYEESDADDEMEIEHTFDTLNRQEKIQDFLGRVPQPRKRKTPDQPQKHNPKNTGSTTSLSSLVTDAWNSIIGNWR
ncbi:unnamed protein product [Diamesa hyperborea]